MIDLSELFPKAQSHPVPPRIALEGIETRNQLTKEQLKWWERLKPGQSGGDIHPKGHWYALFKLNPRNICRTITKSSGAEKVCYWDTPHGVSIDGYKRLGSFPDQYILTGGYKGGKSIIGNSVPPLMIRAVATQIRHKIFGGKALKPYLRKMAYLDILEEAWQQHLAPREPNAPTVISTFAGGGGSSLGYSMAGYKELLAVEWDNNAVATFKLNFPEVPVYHGDIAKLSVEECMRLAGLTEPGELDLLDSSPPLPRLLYSREKDYD